MRAVKDFSAASFLLSVTCCQDTRRNIRRSSPVILCAGWVPIHHLLGYHCRGCWITNTQWGKWELTWQGEGCAAGRTKSCVHFTLCGVFSAQHFMKTLWDVLFWGWFDTATWGLFVFYFIFCDSWTQVKRLLWCCFFLHTHSCNFPQVMLGVNLSGKVIIYYYIVIQNVNSTTGMEKHSRENKNAPRISYNNQIIIG